MERRASSKANSKTLQRKRKWAESRTMHCEGTPSLSARYQVEHETLGEERREYRGSQVSGHCPFLLFLTREQELLEAPLRIFSSFTLALSARGPWFNPKGRSQDSPKPSDVGELEESSSEWQCSQMAGQAHGGAKTLLAGSYLCNMRNTSSCVQRLSQGNPAEAKGQTG